MLLKRLIQMALGVDICGFGRLLSLVDCNLLYILLRINCKNFGDALIFLSSIIIWTKFHFA